MRLHHAVIATADPDALADFYVRILGFDVVPKADRSSLWLKLGDALLMLEKSSVEDVRRPFLEKRKGLHLLAFTITKDERQARLDALGRAGVAIEHESAHSLYFFDPDGNRIALSHYPDPR